MAEAPADNAAKASVAPNHWEIDGQSKKDRTTGEKWFHRITYTGFAEIATFLSSILFAYLAKFSRIKFPGSEQSWSEKWSQWGEKVGDRTLMTTALMMGGNLFVIPIRYMEGHKKEIVHFFNKKFGKEGEVEKGDQQVKNEPPQSWGSLLKGRVLAWLTVFTSLTVAHKFIGPQMDKFEEMTGDLFVRAGKAIKPDLGERPEFRLRKGGELSSIDLFATLAASAIMQTSSKIIARRRASRENAPAPSAATESGRAPEAVPSASSPVEKKAETASADTVQATGGAPQEASRQEDSAPPSAGKATSSSSTSTKPAPKEWSSEHSRSAPPNARSENYTEQHSAEAASRDGQLFAVSAG